MKEEALVMDSFVTGLVVLPGNVGFDIITQARGGAVAFRLNTATRGGQLIAFHVIAWFCGFRKPLFEPSLLAWKVIFRVMDRYVKMGVGHIWNPFARDSHVELENILKGQRFNLSEGKAYIETLRESFDLAESLAEESKKSSGL